MKGCVLSPLYHVKKVRLLSTLSYLPYGYLLFLQ